MMLKQIGHSRPVASSEVKRQQVRTRVMEDATFAQNILARMVRQGEVHGWCTLTRNKPSKSGGYVQVSADGANHFMMLQHIVLCADGQSGMFDQNGVLPKGMHASHLCGNTRCMTIGHVHVGSVQANNQRKGCPVWIPCPHVDEGCKSPVILACPHKPVCIKYVGGFASMDDVMARLAANHRMVLPS